MIQNIEALMIRPIPNSQSIFIFYVGERVPPHPLQCCALLVGEGQSALLMAVYPALQAREKQSAYVLQCCGREHTVIKAENVLRFFGK